MARPRTRAGAPPATHSYVAFANEGDFGAWHDQACLDAGVPFPHYVDGVPALADQWTVALYSPVLIDGTELCIYASAEAIAADATLKQLPVIVPKQPAYPGADVDANGDPISEITVDVIDVAQPLPPTWTDPETGQEYPVP